MNLSIEGKTALICGGSQGIGYAIAEELALMGANCILLARNEEALRIAVTQLDSSIRQLHRYHAIDFNNEAALKELIRSIVAEGPCIS
jgi:3-oxoacyl-[acyl-carrier protein] reductase